MPWVIGKCIFRLLNVEQRVVVVPSAATARSRLRDRQPSADVRSFARRRLGVASLTSSQNQHADVVARRDLAAAAGSSARTARARSCSAARTGTCPADRSGPAASPRSAPASPCAARRAAGSTSAGRPCTGAAGWRRSLRCVAVSTMWPAYMTLTRSAMPATTPIEWVIMITPVPSSLCRRAHQLEDLRLDRHVERGRRLVGDQQLRIAGERHRDHHALAHTARELVRVLVDALFGVRDADHLEQLDRARACA